MTTANCRLPTPQARVQQANLSMLLLRYLTNFFHHFLQKLNINFQKQKLFHIIFQLAAVRKPDASNAQTSAFTFVASLHYATALKNTWNDKSAKKVANRKQSLRFITFKDIRGIKVLKFSMTVIQDIIHFISRLDLRFLTCIAVVSPYKSTKLTLTP